MRAMLMLLAIVFAGGCDETEHSNFHPDFGVGALPIGAACAPDTPPTSECEPANQTSLVRGSSGR